MAKGYRIVKVETRNKVPVTKYVCQWNSWDGEHLTVVHAGYEDAFALYEGGNCSMSEVVTRIPFLRIRLKTPIFVVQDDQNTQYTFARQLGVWSRTRIWVNSCGNETEVVTEYSFALRGVRKVLYWPLTRLIPKWNEAVWNEDLPVKLRRQKVLDLGFVDFGGLKSQGPIKPDLSLPMRKPIDSPVCGHPLYFKSRNRFVVGEDSAEFIVS